MHQALLEDPRLQPRRTQEDPRTPANKEGRQTEGSSLSQMPSFRKGNRGGRRDKKGRREVVCGQERKREGEGKKGS